MTSQEVWLRGCLSKKRYSTMGFAGMVIEKIKKERGIDLYTYRCPSCQGFHLTKRKEYSGEYQTR